MKKIIFWAIYNKELKDISNSIFETKKEAEKYLKKSFICTTNTSNLIKEANLKNLSVNISSVLKQTLLKYKVIKIEGKIITKI
jgi:NAD-dependent SIR2 family protein deacetylase